MNEYQKKAWDCLTPTEQQMRGTGRAGELCEHFELDASGRIRRMSKGMKQKVAIVCALMHDPAVLILDEPTSGLDPLMQNRFIDLILEEKQRGKTVLMSSHMFEEVERTCARVGILREGRLAAVEEIGTLKARRSRTYSVTLSTLHGCPPQEIERIATYLIEVKGLHTFIKCNPTLLGYEYARKLMDDMGYDYVAFGDFHFRDDLQYTDAVPMLQRLQKLADKKGLEFGVKITNTFPVDVKQNELPSEEMYMSGKSLYALSMSVAQKLAKDFDGKLRISYSGGADYFNITKIVDAGIWPVTMATTMLKPGGYERLEQIGQLFKAKEVFSRL